MAAKANSENEYYRIAKQRWSQYSISGSGSLAVVFECCRRVELTVMPMMAQVIVNERCGQHCGHITAPEGGWHTIETIKLPRPYTVTVLRDWEED